MTHKIPLLVEKLTFVQQLASISFTKYIGGLRHKIADTTTYYGRLIVTK